MADGTNILQVGKKVKAQTSSSAVTLQVGIKVKPSFINVKFSWVKKSIKNTHLSLENLGSDFKHVLEEMT